MALIAGGSPVFGAPRPGWELTAAHALPARPGGGTLDMRIGHCRGPESKTLAEQAEAIARRERAGDPIATKGDLRTSLVPVVLVDGEPVATGWGRIRLPLAAGRHLVEVQSQHSRAWRAVDIAAGATTKVDYIGILGDRHRAYATGEPLGSGADYTGHTIGPRGRLNFWPYLPANARARRSFITAVLAGLACVPLALMAALIGVDAASAAVAAAITWAVLLGAWGSRVLWTYLRYNRCEPGPPLDTRAFAAPGLLAPTVLDPDGAAPEPEPGMAAVLIDARFVKDDLTSAELALQLPPGRGLDRHQRKAVDDVGEAVPIRHRCAVPPPVIEVDEVRTAASWTRMWIPIRPGRHRITVRTPDAPMPVRSTAAPARTGTVEVDAPAGQTTALELAVSVKAVPEPTEPRLHEWACGIERFGPAPEPQRPAAPRADVRGGLRRAATGRWWDRPERSHR